MKKAVETAKFIYYVISIVCVLFSVIVNGLFFLALNSKKKS